MRTWDRYVDAEALDSYVYADLAEAAHVTHGPGLCDCCPDDDDADYLREEAAYAAQLARCAVSGAVPCPCGGGHGETPALGWCACCSGFGSLTPAEAEEHEGLAGAA